MTLVAGDASAQASRAVTKTFVGALGIGMGSIAKKIVGSIRHVRVELRGTEGARHISHLGQFPAVTITARKSISRPVQITLGSVNMGGTKGASAWNT